MPKIRNVSPLGELDVPLLGAVVEHGAAVDVSTEHATVLLAQEANWKPADEAAKDILAALAGEGGDETPADDAGAEEGGEGQ